MLDRHDGQERFVNMIGRLLDLGFLRQIVHLRELIDWMRSEGSTPFPFESMRELASPDPSGKRRALYAPIAQNVFVEIFGVGNDSLGVIGRRWPEAFPPSNVEREAHATLLRSGVQRSRSILRTEPNRRAMRVCEGIEIIAAEVEASCVAHERVNHAGSRGPTIRGTVDSEPGSGSSRRRLRENKGNDWISIGEASREFGVARSTIHSWTIKARLNKSVATLDSGSREVLMRRTWFKAELRRRKRG